MNKLRQVEERFEEWKENAKDGNVFGLGVLADVLIIAVASAHELITSYGAKTRVYDDDLQEAFKILKKTSTFLNENVEPYLEDKWIHGSESAQAIWERENKKGE